MTSNVHTAPPNSGQSVLDKTLPTLLYDACEQFNLSNALNQPTAEGWEPFSLDEFRRQAEETALGLRALGLERGDRVALFMESDVYFGIADMGCLLAGLIDVPIYLSHASDAIQYVLEHSEAKAVFASDDERLAELAPVLEEAPTVETVIVVQREGDSSHPDVPAHIDVLTLRSLRDRGRERAGDQRTAAVQELRDQLDPQDLATIIYTSGTTGQPKGVMLTHENISHNALASFSGITGYEPGEEVAVSFLPLTHIFARTLHYGYLSYGTPVYFTTPDDLGETLKEVQPTQFATVPRVLEKVYARIREKADAMTGIKKMLLNWALRLARRYELSSEPSGLYRLQLALADRLVFDKWREAVGGRIKYIVVGGAALSAELANIFGAAGITCLQGYGLTETSPVITFNRPERNRAGTVGQPIADVEVKIGEENEILTRGPHVMKGYYKDEEKTSEVLEEDGWFHTGDVGDISEDGFLRITDRKKDLFKLSTGKYVTPSPLENRLTSDPLIEQAVVVGSDRKFCSALLFPDQDSLQSFADAQGLGADKPVTELLQEPTVIARYQELVEEANEGMDPWTAIKRFALIPEQLTVEDELLTPTMKVKRRKIDEVYGEHVEALYADTMEERLDGSVLVEQEEPVQAEPEKAPA